MTAKQIYKRKLHEQLEAWNRQISKLKEKADHAPDSDAEAEFNGQVEEIHALQQAAKGELKKLEEAEETAWEYLKEDIEKAWDSLEHAVKRFYELYKE